MATFMNTRALLAQSANAHPLDVVKIKSSLNALGHYQAPDWGISQYPDSGLFRAIKAFQKAQGLKTDGVIKPGGETLAALQEQLKGAKGHSATQTAALALQGLGRNGDEILAHITPAEAMMLKQQGGAGTVNPATGLLEFYNADNKEGQYTWRTVNDGKVRSSHAARDGKVFSWNNPPEGGHPGEAYNCRCTAEPVESKDGKCKELKHKIQNQEIAVREAEQDRERIQKEFEEANDLQIRLDAKCREAQMKSMGKSGASIDAGWLTGGPVGAVIGGGKALLTSGGDAYETCSKAGAQKKKANELKERRDSAWNYVVEQRDILSALRDEHTNLGCGS